MEDFIIDDNFKSDKYRVSINELLFSRVYKANIDSISKVLDNNGYFGRYKIESFCDSKYGTDVLIRIYVYLPDSSHTYCWPFNTFFNINRKLFGHNRKAPGNILSDQTMLKYSFLVLSVMFSRFSDHVNVYDHHDSMCIRAMKTIKDENCTIEEWPFVICRELKCIKDEGYFSKIVSFLCRIGLIKNNRFLISGKQDADEVSSNLFDINYWYNI